MSGIQAACSTGSSPARLALSQPTSPRHPALDELADPVRLGVQSQKLLKCQPGSLAIRPAQQQISIHTVCQGCAQSTGQFQPNTVALCHIACCVPSGSSATFTVCARTPPAAMLSVVVVQSDPMPLPCLIGECCALLACLASSLQSRRHRHMRTSQCAPSTCCSSTTACWCL